MSDVRLTLGDLDTLAPASFDGTEVMEAYKASEGQSYKTPIVATAAANTWTGVQTFEANNVHSGDNTFSGDNDFTGLQTFTGGVNFPATTVSANYTVAAGVSTVNVNAASATIVLPAATLVGRRVTVRKISASAGTVTISRAGADTIEGATSKVIKARYGTATFECIASGTWSMVHRYEKGTWTPSLSSGTGTISFADYTINGNDIVLSTRIAWATNGSGADPITVVGLPYDYPSGFSRTGSLAFIGMALDGGDNQGNVVTDSTTTNAVLLIGSPSGSGIDASRWVSGAAFIFSITYPVSE